MDGSRMRARYTHAFFLFIFLRFDNDTGWFFFNSYLLANVFFFKAPTKKKKKNVFISAKTATHFDNVRPQYFIAKHWRAYFMFKLNTIMEQIKYNRNEL